MAIVIVQTVSGPQECKVCDYCKCVCCKTQFCSGHCARSYYEAQEIRRETKIDAAGRIPRNA
jgi:hypothetical protein